MSKKLIKIVTISISLLIIVIISIGLSLFLKKDKSMPESGQYILPTYKVYSFEITEEIDSIIITLPVLTIEGYADNLFVESSLLLLSNSNAKDIVYYQLNDVSNELITDNQLYIGKVKLYTLELTFSIENTLENSLLFFDKLLVEKDGKESLIDIGKIYINLIKNNFTEISKPSLISRKLFDYNAISARSSDNLEFIGLNKGEIYPEIKEILIDNEQEEKIIVCEFNLDSGFSEYEIKPSYNITIDQESFIIVVGLHYRFNVKRDIDELLKLIKND